MNMRVIISAIAAVTAACAAVAERYRSSLVDAASIVPPAPPPQEGDRVTISGFSHICDVSPENAESKAKCVLSTDFVRNKLAENVLDGLSFQCGQPQYRGEVEAWDQYSRSEQTYQRFETVCTANGRSVTAYKPEEAVMKIMQGVGLDPSNGLRLIQGGPMAIDPEKVLPKTPLDHLCVYLRREWNLSNKDRTDFETGFIDRLACEALGDKALKE